MPTPFDELVVVFKAKPFQILKALVRRSHQFVAFPIALNINMVRRDE
jgi:hypothetical protein